jgi:hypothetical protein
MSVKFDLGSGVTVYTEDNALLIDTQRGMIAASDVVQGDFICNVSGEPRNEVMSPPVVT